MITSGHVAVLRASLQVLTETQGLTQHDWAQLPVEPNTLTYMTFCPADKSWELHYSGLNVGDFALQYVRTGSPEKGRKKLDDFHRKIKEIYEFPGHSSRTA